LATDPHRQTQTIGAVPFGQGKPFASFGIIAVENMFEMRAVRVVLPITKLVSQRTEVVIMV
jgi:hypothetical protein